MNKPREQQILANFTSLLPTHARHSQETEIPAKEYLLWNHKHTVINKSSEIKEIEPNSIDKY